MLLDSENSEKLQNTAWTREIAPDEILYLLDHWPFLQIVNTAGTGALPEPEFITASSGWVIHNYGDAAASSPGKFLFGGGDYRVTASEGEHSGETGDGDTGLINPNKGTVVKQAYDTAAEMIRLAQRLQWRGVKIIDGHPLMLWAAWMQATDDAFPLEGFEPTLADRQKRERVKRSAIDDQVKIHAQKFRR